MRNRLKKEHFFILLSVLAVLCAVWYLFGRPNVVLARDGSILVELTEEPKINALFERPQPPKPAPAAERPAQAGSGAKKEYSFEGDLNYPENSPLYFGNPSDCVAELSSADNYLLEKEQFVVCYNNSTLCPSWTAWHLSSADFGEAKRSNRFKADLSLPQEWYAVSASDYRFAEYGFDRGHLCPSADRTANAGDNEVTFLMTNMVPQAPDCNRIVWMHLEAFERELALDGYELYIFAGTYGRGGVSDKGRFENITVTAPDGSELELAVPEFTWKILLAIPEGDDDFARTDEAATVIAALVPNRQGCAAGADWYSYLTTVDYIEELTGYDFFELLSDEIEAKLEGTIYQYER